MDRRMDRPRERQTDRRAVMTRLVVAVCSMSVHKGLSVLHEWVWFKEGQLSYNTKHQLAPLLLGAAMDSRTRDLERVLFLVLFARLSTEGNVSEHCVIIVMCLPLLARQIEIQDAYKLSEDFAKPYFHKYCTEIHDVTTIWKSHHFQRHYQNCESASTPQSGTSHKTCFRGFGGNESIAWTSAVSQVGRISNAFNPYRTNVENRVSS